MKLRKNRSRGPPPVWSVSTGDSKNESASELSKLIKMTNNKQGESKESKRSGKPSVFRMKPVIGPEAGEYQILTLDEIVKPSREELVRLSRECEVKQESEVQVSEMEDVTMWTNFMVRKFKEYRECFVREMEGLEKAVINGVEKARNKKRKITVNTVKRDVKDRSDECIIQEAAPDASSRTVVKKPHTNLETSNAKKSDQSDEGSRLTSLVPDARKEGDSIMAQILDKQVKENANSTESDGSLSDEKTFTSWKQERKKDDDLKERQYGELVIPADAQEEPSWCFIADTIEATIFHNRKEAGKAAAELTADLINDDVLTMRVRAVENFLIVGFSFDYDGIACEQVRAWFMEEDDNKSYLRKLQQKEGHWRQLNRGLGGYAK